MRDLQHWVGNSRHEVAGSRTKLKTFAGQKGLFQSCKSKETNSLLGSQLKALEAHTSNSKDEPEWV
jgi:hypothetical protein